MNKTADQLITTMSTTDSKLKTMIFHKLFAAFSEIVVELIHHCDLDVSTRDVLSSNISNISKVLLECSESASPETNVAKVTSKKSAITASTRVTRSVTRSAKNKANQGQKVVVVNESPSPTPPIELQTVAVQETLLSAV